MPVQTLYTVKRMTAADNRLSYLRAAWGLIREALLAWHRDNVSRLAAALAFYALFSMAPALLIIIAVASTMIGESAARQESLAYLEGWMGAGRAEFMLSLGERANRELSGALGTLIGAGALLFGATILFAELRKALNDIWNVTHPPGKRRAVKRYLMSRLLAFLMVLSLGGLLSAAVSANAALNAAGELIGGFFEVPGFLLQLGAMLIAFALMTLLFATIFKVLPETEIRWGDVWLGAFVTALLLSFGNYLIGLYLGRSSLGSVYGAAGSLVLVLVWVYYSLRVFLLGAQFTAVYTRQFGSRAQPADGSRGDRS